VSVILFIIIITNLRKSPLVPKNVRIRRRNKESEI